MDIIKHLVEQMRFSEELGYKPQAIILGEAIVDQVVREMSTSMSKEECIGEIKTMLGYQVIISKRCLTRVEVVA